MTLWQRIKSVRFSPPRWVIFIAQQWGPNRTDALALVSLDEKPFKAVWPITQFQLIGGRRWSFGLTIYTDTPKLERKRFRGLTVTTKTDTPKEKETKS